MKIIDVSASFTRPDDTTAYADNDLVANSTTAGEVAPMTFKIPYGRGLKLYRIEVLKSGATNTNAKFTVRLYKDSPTAANGDNGAWSTTASGYQGSVAIDMTAAAFTDDGFAGGSPTTVPHLIYADADQKLYALMTATAAYTPAALEVFTVRLIGEAYA
jgi:hypothetical protein